MRILVSGSNGLVGRSLIPRLELDGHSVVRLSRDRVKVAGAIYWNPMECIPDEEALEGFDAVIHLAGESIAEGRWTAAKKQRIHDSRVIGTRVLCKALARTQNKPRVLICASAVGYYGSQGNAWLDEESSPGSGFLADTCVKWEAAAEAARTAGIRVVHARLGMVLGREGGALKKMLPIFKLCLGGRLGSGTQYVSWISLEDVVHGIQHCLGNSGISGPVNFVSPNPVTNSDFTKALASSLGRPVGPPAPAFALRLVLGEIADEVLLASVRVKPRRLEESGFVFQCAELSEALEQQIQPRK